MLHRQLPLPWQSTARARLAASRWRGPSLASASRVGGYAVLRRDNKGRLLHTTSRVLQESDNGKSKGIEKEENAVPLRKMWTTDRNQRHERREKKKILSNDSGSRDDGKQAIENAEKLSAELFGELGLQEGLEEGSRQDHLEGAQHEVSVRRKVRRVRLGKEQRAEKRGRHEEAARVREDGKDEDVASTSTKPSSSVKAEGTKAVGEKPLPIRRVVLDSKLQKATLKDKNSEALSKAEDNSQTSSSAPAKAAQSSQPKPERSTQKKKSTLTKGAKRRARPVIRKINVTNAQIRYTLHSPADPEAPAAAAAPSSTHLDLSTVGTATISNAKSLGTTRLNKTLVATLKPLSPTWFHGQKEQSLLLLFTAAFANRIASSEDGGHLRYSLVRQIVWALFLKNLRKTPVEKVKVAVAVVDKLHGGLRSVEGQEGLAYALVDDLEITPIPLDDLTLIPDPSASHSSADKFISLRLPVEDSTVPTEAASPSTPKGDYAIQLPLANTVFQTDGFYPSLLASFTYKNVPYSNPKEPEHTSILALDGDPVELTGATTALKMCGLTSVDVDGNAGLKVSTPLVPLTQPRSVEAAMGNIVRQLRPLEAGGEVIRASAELEDAVNGLVRSTGLPSSPVAVWSLIVPTKAQARLAEQGISLPNITPVTADSNDFPDLTLLLRAGARLHRVMSGGGGWGKKAGLLSLSPAVSFEVAKSSALGEIESEGPEGELLPPWMRSQARELGEALGSPIEKGDWVQFLLALPQASHPAAKATVPEISNGMTIQIGTIPSSVDAMPAIETKNDGERKADTQLQSGLLGVLSEKGFALSLGKTQSMIDVHFSMLQFSIDSSSPSPVSSTNLSTSTEQSTSQALQKDVAIQSSPQHKETDPILAQLHLKRQDILRARQRRGEMIQARFAETGKPAYQQRRKMREVETDRLFADLPSELDAERVVSEKARPKVPADALRQTETATAVPIRKLNQKIRNPVTRFHFQVKIHENNEKVYAAYQRAVRRALAEKGADGGQAAAAELAQGSPPTAAAIAIEPQKSGAGSIAEKEDKSNARLSEDVEAYTRKLEGMDEVELAKEREYLDAALNEARRSRRQAEKAIRDSEIPDHVSTPSLDPRVDSVIPTKDDVNDQTRMSPAFQQVRKMDFAQLSAYFLECRDRLLTSKDGNSKEQVLSHDNMVKYWRTNGFPPALVRMLHEYHAMAPAIPDAGLKVFEQSHDIPFAELRAAAAKLPPSKRLQFWRKWKLLRSISNTIKSQARLDFVKQLEQNKLLEKAAREQSETERTMMTDVTSDINTEVDTEHFRSMLFRMLGRSIRTAFHRKHRYWAFDYGLKLEKRNELWDNPQTGKILQAAMQWVARLNYRTGDAVASSILDRMAWQRQHDSTERLRMLRLAQPKLHVTFRSGDAHQAVAEFEGVKLMHTPDARSVMLSDDTTGTWRSLSERSPWEFLYRLLLDFPDAKLPDHTVDQRSPENNWHMRRQINAPFEQLAPIFQKFDDAIRAHGDKPGLVEVDIGNEIRENFPHLLRTESALRKDLGLAPVKVKLRYGSVAAPLRNVRGRDVPVIRVRSSPLREPRRDKYGKPLFKTIRIVPTKKFPAHSEAFESAWRKNPNTFAWELMEKKLRAKVDEKIKARLAQGKQAAVPVPMRRIESGEEAEDDAEDVDYDLAERRIERRLDRLGIRQPSVKRMDLEALERKREIEVWEDSQAREDYKPVLNRFAEIEEVAEASSRSPSKPTGKPRPIRIRSIRSCDRDTEPAPETSWADQSLPQWQDGDSSTATQEFYIPARRAQTAQTSGFTSWPDQWEDGKDVSLVSKKSGGGRRRPTMVKKAPAEKPSKPVDEQKEEKEKLRANILKLLGRL